MKLRTLITTVFIFITLHAFSQAIEKLKTGDIIFQTSRSKTALAIELATHSKFSHVGVVIHDNGKVYVLEAIQPVSITPIDQFISRGDKKYYEVKRLKNKDSKISPAMEQMLIARGKTIKGLNYDFAFNWSDEELYCSELVYKLYKDVLKIELAKPEALKTFDLSSPQVKEQLKIKYGNKIPYDEQMISPQQIYESAQLLEVN